MSSATNSYTAPRSSKSLSETAALYRPFIGGLIIVLIATSALYFMRSNHGVTDTHQIMNIFMGCLFIVFSIPKFFNLYAFAEVFQKYDLISKRVPAYALLFPFIELCLGLLLLSSIPASSMLAGRLINVVVAVISGLGVISVIRSLQQKKNLDCACMGTAFKFPLSKVAIIENGIMLIMALAMLILMKPDHMVMAALINFPAAV